MVRVENDLVRERKSHREWINRTYRDGKLTNAAARVHGGGERRRHRFDGLDEPEGRAALELVHGQSQLGCVRYFGKELTVDGEHSHL